MLPEFKKRIDTLRDILVGAVPSPAGQIEQITYALIYKFMSDIDDRAASIPGGKRTYFPDEYEKYNWHTLMSTTGAHEQLALYREALSKMTHNPGLPVLFQEIYQNAYLTFNDPRVLRLFLKSIDTFEHSSSDDIGDAYEYLLQITGAQGDVGQFRTPRHIIKFITEAVNPGKDDSVLDPAVGTAGFLIAAYNHVKHHHDGVDEITGLPDKNEHDLTADEREKLYKNYHGFDIDPTMVRTAKVNMYLHGFTTPDIKNHDSLSSEEHWEKEYDIILANPPFMSPKGGIKPHDKFGIVANRAEVLFVDYIASHLKPTGRAGIIVPEGVIFQSGKAYKELRKNLVENYLYAVVSLPAGVFQPYSGVKTSVLLLDKELAKRRDEILFLKIENDGFSTGSQRREKAGSQFPQALQYIDSFQSGIIMNDETGHVVAKQVIAESDDYNLSGDRYRQVILRDDFKYKFMKLGSIVDIIGGSTPLKSNAKYWLNGEVPWFTVDDIRKNGRNIKSTQKHITDAALKETSIKIVPKDSVLLCCTASIGEYAITSIPTTTNQQFNALVVRDQSTLLPKYLYWSVSDFKSKLERMAGKTSFSFVSGTTLKNMQIPLPPIEIQREIVTELDGYQKIIDAAQTIAKTYKPTIKINPEWTYVKLSTLIKGLEAGVSVNSDSRPRTQDEKGVLKTSSVTYGYFNPDENKVIIKKEITRAKLNPRKDSIIISRMNTPLLVGASAYIDKDYDDLFLPDRLWQTVRANDNFSMKYVFHVISSPEYRKIISGISGGTSGSMKNISKKTLLELMVPLPAIEEQEQIVAQLEAEQQLINANKKLIDLYTEKIKTKIAEVWGE